jgi:hypothetical protein
MGGAAPDSWWRRHRGRTCRPGGGRAGHLQPGRAHWIDQLYVHPSQVAVGVGVPCCAMRCKHLASQRGPCACTPSRPTTTPVPSTKGRASGPWPSAMGRATKKSAPTCSTNALWRWLHEARLPRRLALLLCVAAAGCAVVLQPPLPSVPLPAAADLPPPEPREFRGAWVATVANIDWPSKPGLSGAAQRDEAIALLDRARTIGLNAIVLQVRPAGDAIYPSALEPWTRIPQRRTGPRAAAGGRAGLGSAGLLGARSAPPRPGTACLVQPLPRAAFGGQVAAGRQPHRRAAPGPGQDLWRHAVDGPRRTRSRRAYAGRGGRRGAPLRRRWRAHRRLLLPLPRQAGEVDLPFPDDDAYARHLLGGGTLARDDWRRSNVDGLVQRLRQTVQAIKPQVRVGISPFGLGRPDRRPPGVTASASTTSCMPMSKAGCKRAGWTTWRRSCTGRSTAKASPLRCCWTPGWPKTPRAATSGRACSPARSHAASPLGPRSWPARNPGPGAAAAHAARSHRPHPLQHGRADAEPRRHRHALQMGPYAQQALVPATPWLDDQPPPAPMLRGRRARADRTRAGRSRRPLGRLAPRARRGQHLALSKCWAAANAAWTHKAPRCWPWRRWTVSAISARTTSSDSDTAMTFLRTEQPHPAHGGAGHLRHRRPGAGLRGRPGPGRAGRAGRGAGAGAGGGCGRAAPARRWPHRLRGRRHQGRLGVLDSVELNPTFGWPPDLRRLCWPAAWARCSAVEGAEDDRDQGGADLRGLAQVGRRTWCCCWRRPAPRPTRWARRRRRAKPAR